MNTEVIAKSSGKIAVVDSGNLVLDQPSIVKIKVGPETVARFEQVGNDLLIVLKDGGTLTVRNFFVQDDEGHRSDLVLEDVEGVHWWGQYTSPWSDFHFAEIQEDVAAAGFMPPAAGWPAWAIAALGLVGAGAVYAMIDDGDDDKHSNRAPESPSYALTVAENDHVNGRVVGSDPDGDALTYAVTTQPANGTVTINPQTGEYTYTPKPGYSGHDTFVVTVSDGKGGSSASTISIDVTAVNDPPAAADPNAGLQPGDAGYIPSQNFDPDSGNYQITTPEDTAIDGKVAGTDADADQLTYVIGEPPSHGTVTIDPETGEYSYMPAPDYNGPDEFTVIIDDGQGGKTTTKVVITVTPENDLPAFEDPNQGGTPTGPTQPGTIFTPPGDDGAGNPTPASYTVNYNENSAAGAALGQVQAGDADGDDVTYTISAGNDDGWYAIDPTTGVITLTPAGAASLANDFEAGSNSHPITVVASDGHGGTTTITVTLNELDVNDAPAFEDPNQGGTPTGPNQPGTIFTPPGDDGAGNPTPASYTVNYNENSAAGAALGQVQAGDADGDDVTYAIRAGNDNGWYAIDPSTGVITLTPAGAASLANDFEAGSNSHPITVVASDGHGGTTTITVTLNELDVNDAPAFEDPNQGGTPTGPNQPGTIFTPPGDDGAGNPTPASYTVNYNENSAAGAALGQVQAGDSDGDDVTYAISAGNDNGWYAIDPTTGVITLTPAGAASLANDFEAGSNSHPITVVASDGHGGTTTITVTLNELDVNDSSPIVTNATADTLYESGLPNGLAAAGEPTTITATGTITVTDPDSTGPAPTLTLSGPTDLTANGGSPVTWSGDGSPGNPLIGMADGAEVFRATIDATGRYDVTLSGALDQPHGNGENTGSFDLTVRADDGVNPPGEGTLTINIVDDQPSAAPVTSDIVLPEQDSNIMLILDLSGSMNAQRMAMMKAAVTQMLDQYDALGDVKVRIVTFGTDANAHGDVWESVADAKAYVQSLTNNLGNTNYDAALLKAMEAFAAAGRIDGAANISYFLTDGEPTRGTGWPQVPGAPVTQGIQPEEEAIWKQFLEENGIYSHTYGMGPDASKGNMNPVAYDGVHASDTDAIVVPNVDDLPPILRDSIGIHQSGGVLENGGVDVSMMGADGGHVASITVNGVTYDFAGAVDGGTSHGTWDATEHTWSINTSLGGDFTKGGTLVFDMDTGEYTYAPPITSTQQQEHIDFVLVDNDGDSAQSTLTITVHPPGTVLSSGGGGSTSFTTEMGEMTAGTTGDEPHALPALADLVASPHGSDLDAAWTGGATSAYDASLTQFATPVPSMHPLDQLEQHHQAMV